MFTNTLHIFTKEIHSYFQSRLAWFVFAAYTALSMAMVFFRSTFLTIAEPELISFFRFQAIVFTLIIPALTLKLWVDEKRQGTLELTVSLPFSRAALCLGKFLAVWGLTGLMLISTMGLWLSTAGLSQLNNLGILQNYLWCWLFCGVLCSVSLCASFFTNNQVSAFVLSLAICLALVLVNFAGLLSLMGFSSPVFLRIAKALNFGSRFDDLIAGQLSAATFFYYLTLALAALWLNIAALCWRSYSRSKLAVFAACLVLAFAAANIAMTLIGGFWSLDTSSDSRFSLSAPTKAWLKANSTDLFVRLYYSPKADKEYTTEILNLLEQYQLHSHRQLSLLTVETSPLSPEEAEARKAGIRDIPGQPTLGLVMSDSNGRFATIPHLDIRRRNYLEHDISRALSSLGQYQKPTIGIVSPEIGIISSGSALDYQPDWPFVAALRPYYNLQYISAKQAVIPSDIDLLLVINPQSVTPLLTYALDQYLMRGGNIIIFLDPLSEVALATKDNPGTSSSLQAFLQNLGIIYSEQIVVGDNLSNRQLRQKPYPFWLMVDGAADSHLMLQGIRPLALNSAGWFDWTADTKPEPRVLLSTSADSGVVNALYLRHASTEEALRSYISDHRRRPLAILQEGKFASLFSAPVTSLEVQPFFSVSVQDGRLMLVADSDMLDSRLWNANPAADQQPYDFWPSAGNPDFVERAVDYMSGNHSILSISPKFGALAPDSLNHIMVQGAEKNFAAALNEVAAELNKTVLAQAELQRQIAAAEVMPSLQITRQIEELEYQKQDLLRQQRGLQAQILRRYKLYLGAFMALNFAAPLLILAWFIAISRYYSRRLIERIING